MSTRTPVRAARSRWGRAIATATAVVLMMPLGVGFANANPAISAELEPFLDLPLVNRDAAHGPGGVNPALPYDKAQLENLLEKADREGVDPPRYAALLLQYRLVDVTEAAGIDLVTWDPRAGVEANRQNLIDSYSYYVGLQLSHRELQWAGMGGLVGADFGGGLIDFELMSGIYDFPGMAQTANAIVEQTLEVLGPDAVALLPEGLQALARSGATITPQDLQQILGEILVMQKNIFSDLMPMHQAYVTEGLPALEKMHRAGLFDDSVLNAWIDVASGENDRIAAGNRVLLQREQGEVISSQWDDVRNYKGDVGEAITYASTIAASPSVAGVVPPRSYKPITISTALADGRTATLTTPLPSWNWSVFDQRWDYISAELLPKYKAMVENNWPQLESELREPYDQKLEGARPLRNIPQLLQSALEGTTVTFA